MLYFYNNGLPSAGYPSKYPYGGTAAITATSTFAMSTITNNEATLEFIVVV